MVKKRFELRAHHGMCLAFFEGKGYSKEFTQHMQIISDAVKNDPMLHVIIKEYVICQQCPNLKNGVCETRELVREYDRKVLDLCGIKENTEISWQGFSNLVREKVIAAGKRESICGNCQWTDICKSKEPV